MRVTAVRIQLAGEGNDPKVLAFVNVVFDHCFVVKEMRLIDGFKGKFAEVPSRKLMDKCHACHTRNHLLARYCNQCGVRLADGRAVGKDGIRLEKIHADVAFPTTQEMRRQIDEAVLQAYNVEVECSKQPGYVLDYYDHELLA